MTNQNQQPSLMVTVPRFRALTADADGGVSVVELIRDATGGERLNLRDLDMVRVPTGGATQWLVPTASGEEARAYLIGVIVYWHTSRARWESAYTGTGTPPVCRSSDGVTGTGDPGGLCEVCPFARFGAAGERPECRVRRLLYVVQPDDLLPTIVSVPPTSIGPVKKYLLQLARSGLSHKQVVTRLELTRAKSRSGITYAQIVPTMVAQLPPADVERVRAYADALIHAVRGAPVPDEAFGLDHEDA
jgi:hypothetical protein